jgi:beta-lactam-binding protein with PASTA domain
VVPAVVGTPFGAAVRALESAGLRVEGTPLACPSGTVTAQDTPAGEQLVRGSTVAVMLTGCAVTTSTP